MIKTFGLTHIALAVKDPERSLRFYQQVFGMVEVPDGYESEIWYEPQTPVDPVNQTNPV